MTDSMIERMARAICPHVGPAFDNLPREASYIERKTYSDRPFRDQKEALTTARVLFAELLTPSTSMLIAGVKAMRNPCLDVTEKELVLGWIAMIEKALGE